MRSKLGIYASCYGKKRLSAVGYKKLFYQVMLLKLLGLAGELAIITSAKFHPMDVLVASCVCGG